MSTKKKAPKLDTEPVDSSRWHPREEILGITTIRDRNDVTHFRDLDLERLETLVSEGFVALDERWNDAPTVRIFIEFMRAWPWARAHGYAVHPARPDRRVTIEGLECNSSVVPAEQRDALREAFLEKFRTADELNVGTHLRAWWD